MTYPSGSDASVATPDSRGREEIRQFAAAVAEIATALESPHDADGRISHVLTVVRRLVPCDRCALYRPAIDGPGAMIVVPVSTAEAGSHLAEFLRSIVQFMEGDGANPQVIDARAHLALPVIGLDEILGVLLVDREDGGEYQPHHLRLLSAVASQLGSYLTMGRLHQATAEQTQLLTDREQQLRGAARFREEFIGVVGHDLRNPLSAIRTGAQLLAQRAALDERDRGVARRIVGSADRMSRMIDELMDFARGRLGGGIPLRRSLVDLHALSRDVVDEAQAAHARAVILDLAGNPHGHWDHDRLAQLVSNLVGNALQHSPADGLVRVTVREEPDYAVVEVNNSGTPIPAEQLAHMFEPFRRGENVESAGLGLGLYIVERIVSAHGGGIAVTSTAVDGTTFVVRLPRRRASDRDGRERPPWPNRTDARV